MKGFSLNATFAIAALFFVLVCPTPIDNPATERTRSLESYFWRSARPVPMKMIRRVQAGMTLEQVNSILGLHNGFFYSFSREETYGEWTIEYFCGGMGELLVGSVRHPQFGELLMPSGPSAVPLFEFPPFDEQMTKPM